MPSRITVYEHKKKRNQRIVWLTGLILMVILMAYVGWSRVLPAAAREKTDQVFRQAVKDQDEETFRQLVYVNNKPLKMAETNRLMVWFRADENRLAKAVSEIKSDQSRYPKKPASSAKQDLFSLKQQPGRFWFDTYTLHLNEQTLEVTSDVNASSILVNETPSGNTLQGKPLILKRFPGEYEVSARVQENGKTGRASKTIQLGDQKKTSIAFELASQVAPDQKEQYGIDIEKLLEAEVKARTGKTVKQMTEYLGRSQQKWENTFGPPVNRLANKDVYEGFEVVYDGREVQSIVIDLNKTTSELENVAGKPESKTDEANGKVWKYPTGFFEELLGWLNIKSEKRIIERSGKMWLELR